MKIVTKLALFIIPLILIAVSLINLSYALFFNDFTLKQENGRVDSIKETLSSFLDERKTKYVGSVKDWAYWDDTYNFIENRNQDYIGNLR